MEEQEKDFIMCGWYRPEYKSTTCAYRDFYKCTVYGDYRHCLLRNEIDKLYFNKEKDDGV